MAKYFVDAAVSTEKGSMTQEDGTALTLTNGVRVLYDSTLTTSELNVLIDRIKDKINEFAL